MPFVAMVFTSSRKLSWSAVLPGCPVGRGRRVGLADDAVAVVAWPDRLLLTSCSRQGDTHWHRTTPDDTG